MKVLFVQHDHLSPGGEVARRFEQRGFAVSELLVVPADRFGTPGVTATFPDPASYDALVIMGAPWAAYDDLVGSWVKPELDMLRRADDAAVPVLGICFGGQLLALAHGGSVSRSPAPEIGWHVVHTDDPQLVSEGPWFQWHYDRWTLPPRAEEIARNAAASQAFLLRRNLAVQFHPELDTEGLAGWLDNGGAGLCRVAGLDSVALLEHTRATDPIARERAAGLVDSFVDRFCGGRPEGAEHA